jgi:hypothetical protein
MKIFLSTSGIYVYIILMFLSNSNFHYVVLGIGRIYGGNQRKQSDF